MFQKENQVIARQQKALQILIKKIPVYINHLDFALVKKSSSCTIQTISLQLKGKNLLPILKYQTKHRRLDRLGLRFQTKL